MRSLFILFLLSVAAAAMAQEENDDPPSLMERGAQQFLEGLLQEMEPAIEGMMDFIDQMGPAMRDILDDVQDWSVYEPPEVLPNGDIIIRRKPDVPVEEEPSEQMPQIDL
ncbi:MAG: hypothetical protein AAF636_01655 [Pseudomonadota bacterium]